MSDGARKTGTGVATASGVPNDHLEGLGYGMSLVRAMMKQVGGAVHVANDCGARFTLTAPMPVERYKQKAAAEAAAFSGDLSPSPPRAP